MCAASEAFRIRFGSWPTRMRAFEGAIENFLTEEIYALLCEKLDIVYDGSPFIAEDDQSNQHCYGKDGFVKSSLKCLLVSGWGSNKID